MWNLGAGNTKARSSEGKEKSTEGSLEGAGGTKRPQEQTERHTEAAPKGKW